MDFQQERAAFFGGYGQPPALLEALRDQVLYVPLDHNERYFTLMYGEVPWMLAFTTWARAQEFAVAAERDLASVQASEVTGAALIDKVVTQGPVPTGLVIDAHQADVMVFPPEALDSRGSS